MNRKDCGKRQNWVAARPGRRVAEAAVALAVLCAPALADTIQLWPRSNVVGRQVLLGDIARLSGFSDVQLQRLQAVVIAQAAPPGEHRTVSLPQVRSRLREAGVNLATTWVKGASACVVSTASSLPAAGERREPWQRPADGTLRAAIRAVLGAGLPGDDGDLQLTFEPQDHGLLDLAAPTYAFDVRKIGRPALGHIELDVGIRRGAEPASRRRLHVIAALRRDVLMMARPVERGQIIKRQDLTLSSRSFASLETAGLARPDDAVGQEARRTLGVGEMLRSGDLRAVELVRRNDLIAVQARSAGILIECTGRALQRGYLGEIIEVRNEASEKTYHARVSGLRRAQVVFEHPRGLAAVAQEGATP